MNGGRPRKGISMIIQSSKIEKACADGSDTRGNLRYVYLTEQHTLVATDGHILALNEVLERGTVDEPGPIHPGAFSEARKKHNNNTMQAMKDRVSFDASDLEFKRPDEQKCPKFDAIFEQTGAHVHVISLDADLLHRLAAALCTDGRKIVKIYAGKDKLGSVRVEPANNNGNVGILMPCRTDEEKSNPERGE